MNSKFENAIGLAAVRVANTGIDYVVFKNCCDYFYRESALFLRRYEAKLEKKDNLIRVTNYDGKLIKTIQINVSKPKKPIKSKNL
jgi:hypothetical protein